MPSLATVYRAIVMIATGVIVVKGWQLYGPSTEQVKSFAVAAMEKAQTAWSASPPQTADSAAPAGDPRSAGPPLAMAQSTAEITGPPINSAAPELAPVVNSNNDVAHSVDAASRSPGQLAPDDDALAPLMSRLVEIGGADPQVAAWGSSGQLYRCCCRVKLTDASALAKHFEAVASEPVAAMELVVAKVEAWRTEQQNLLPR